MPDAGQGALCLFSEVPRCARRLVGAQCVFLLPAPSLGFLGHGQACRPLCLFGHCLLKAMSGMGLGFLSLGPALPHQIGSGQASCWQGRRKEEVHLASAGLQNVSGSRWEGLNVGALQNILLQPPPADADLPR